MSKETRIIRFKMLKENRDILLDVPVAVSANDLVKALNAAYHLSIDMTNIKECYLQMENPVALLKGNKTLEEFGIRDGSIIYYTR